MPTTRKPQATTFELIIQWGLAVIVAIMPFHAFLVTWIGSSLGHRSLIQGWKEALLVILGLLAIILLWRASAKRRRLNQSVVYWVLASIGLGLLVTAIARPSFATAIFGLKTDDEFLVAFLLAILVATPTFLRRLTAITLGAGGTVVAFGLAQSYLLPANFLTHFGYGPKTILPYEHIQAGVDSLRLGATLGGPNQLGAYLAIILSLLLVLGWRRRNWWLLAAIIPTAIVLIHTYSRAAWAGAGIALVAAGFGLVPTTRRKLAGGIIGLFALLGAAASSWFISHTALGRHYFLHTGTNSDLLHLNSLRTGWHELLGGPLGHGLGTAGPAVFHTGTGQIIENYFLQIGYEAGIAGLVLFVAISVAVGRELWREAKSEPISLALLAALIGISVNCLVLPAWTDSTTALVFWILAGAAIGSRRPAK